MSQPDDWTNRVVPAQLDFLAIYSPGLATSEATERDQIVCYYSRVQRERRRSKAKDTRPTSEQQTTNDDEDHRMRQIGLAQGLVNFAKDFSNGEPVDSVDTEKHRIVIKELEDGWWIVASIHLTRLPASRSNSNTDANAIEYSSREVSPAALLLQQLNRAHRIFLLHHGQGLQSLYVRQRREKFCSLLDRYWKGFAKSWDVLLHGNPAVDIYSGIKLAAGGELGIGVGEEERGSGEREVLEDIIRNTDGLVDALVFRFGEPDPSQLRPSTHLSADSEEESLGGSTWLGTLDHPGPADGLLFSGMGALSRSSIRDLSDWTRSIYVHGEDAYGVKVNPSSDRRKRRRLLPIDTPAVPSNPIPDLSKLGLEKTNKSSETKPNDDIGAQEPQEDVDKAQITVPAPGIIPPPIVSTANLSPTKATPAALEKDKDDVNNTSSSESNVWMKVLTLGYGTAWGSGRVQSQPKESPKNETLSSSTDADPHRKSTDSSARSNNLAAGTRPKATRRMMMPQGGRFLIGLKGDLSSELHEVESSINAGSGDDSSPNNEGGHRLVMRTIQVEVRESKEQESVETSEYKLRRLRIVVYTSQPFLFLFLFDPIAPSLTLPSFFHTLHNHLVPLHKSLLQSSSPANVSKRLQATVHHHIAVKSGSSSSSTPIYDLVYNPHNLTVHCSVPNVAMPGTLAAEGFSPPASPGDGLSGQHLAAAASHKHWTRVEALTVHAQILNAYSETRREPGERERTVKTSKGWWVAWMRVPAAVGAKSTTRPETPNEDADTTTDGNQYGTDSDSRDSTGALQSSKHMDRPGECNKEAILVRRAGDHVLSRRSTGMGMGGFGMSMGLGRIMGQESAASGGGAGGRLGDMGVDSRAYVERLLSFSR